MNLLNESEFVFCIYNHKFSSWWRIFPFFCFESKPCMLLMQYQIPTLALVVIDDITLV